MLRELDAVPLQVPQGNVSDSMSKGVIDGAIFNYEAAESFGVGTVTRHVLEPSFITGTLILAMNKARHDGLAPDLRAIIDETCGPIAAEKAGRALRCGRNARAERHAGRRRAHQHAAGR